MTREEELFSRHLQDLADAAWKRNVITFSDFLNLNEQNIYHTVMQKCSYIESSLFGGYENAERQMAAFIPDALSYHTEDFSLSEYFPICCLKISPLNLKFSEDLSHRDYLGSLMNLGVDRSKMGDIVIQEQSALLFCEEKLAEYLTKEMTRVRHTAVNCQVCSCGEIQYEPKLKKLTGTVASVRLDALLSLAFQSSRSSLTGMIEGGKTFVNGKLVTSNGYRLKEGDLISVRGLGRFRYCSVSGSPSKKGRYFVEIEKYI